MTEIGIICICIGLYIAKILYELFLYYKGGIK